jgi:hypothetical protein
MTIFTANCIGNENNTSYPNRIYIAPGDIQTMKNAICFDHVAALYRTGFTRADTEKRNPILCHRSNDDFVESDCLMLDVDNTDTENPEMWIQPERIAKDFPGVPHFIATSRNHWKWKDGFCPRPKFHVYFEIDLMTDVKEHRRFKDCMIKHFPYFDFNAKDGARYFFGNPNAEVSYIGG